MEIDFPSDFEQFFLVKNNFVCVCLKNKYGTQIVCFKKIVESAQMPELKKLQTYSWKLKMVYWKKGTKDGPSVNRKLLTHILTNVPTHRHTDIRLGRLQ